jgi:hypothetical protein
MYSEGYRAHSVGHHAVVFAFLGEAIGGDVTQLAGYLDDCRRKRNRADYVGVGGISTTEVEELLKEAGAFAALARQWIHARHPELA